MKKLFLFASILSLAFFSCKKDSNPGGSTSGKAHVTIKMTDAPGNYNAVWLNVKSVVIITDNGQHTLDVGSRAIDILRFRDGRDTVVADADIPAGTIQQIRLVLNDGGNRVILGGVSHDLTTPSGQTSGVKLNVHDELKPGVAYTFKLDFDVAQSIVVTGNDKYILKPVIRVIDEAVSGALVGVIAPVNAYANVYAEFNGETVGTVTDANGKFYFPGLASGTYTLRFEPVVPFTAKTVTNVTIAKGEVTNMGTITLQ